MNNIENEFDFNDEEDDFEQELYDDLDEVFRKLLRKLEGNKPGITNVYDNNMRTAKVFGEAAQTVSDNHDLWLQAVAETQLGDEFTDIISYLVMMYDVSTKTKLVPKKEFFRALVTALKWAFLGGVVYSESSTVPEAFESFLDDLDLDFD